MDFCEGSSHQIEMKYYETKIDGTDSQLLSGYTECHQ